MHYKPLRFPRDHNAHKNIAEWWYFNGHLKDQKGHRYSFMDCLFQADLKRAKLKFLNQIPFKKYTKPFLPYIHFAHSIVTNLRSKKTWREIQHLSLLSRDTFKKKFLYASYHNPLSLFTDSNHQFAQTTATPKDKNDTFKLKTDKLDLTLTSQKPMLMEQGKGFIETCGRQSYYYSYTSLKAKGTINLPGKKTIRVTGKAWMDHQWANISPIGDKWTWFGIQLENGTEIMVAQYEGGKKKGHLVDISPKNGENEHCKQAVFIPSKDRRKIWQSPHTKARYPLAWQIKIPEKKITLNLQSIVKDQEMIFGSINYYEGPVKATALINGKKVKGEGFMELFGYPANYRH